MITDACLVISILYLYDMKTCRNIFGPLMTVLSLAAFVLSLILTLHSLSMAGLAGCSAGSSCDMVTGSRWSMLFGFLPVSSLSMGLYLAAAVCSIYICIYDDAFVKMVMGGLAAAVLAGSAWFIFLQTFVIGAFCPYCMSAHGCGFLLAVCVFIWLVKDGKLPAKSIRNSALAGAAVAVAFIILQILTTPSYRVHTGQTRDPLPIPDASEAPCVGPEDAPHAVALLYDYQCPHCRVIHDMLEDAAARLDGQVCFILCPSPLSPSCNPYIPAGQDLFPGSCTMASLALSLWRHDKDAFRIFDRWLFEDARTEDECTSYALSLYEGARQDDPWVQQYLSGTLELFARTSTADKGGIPRFVYRDKWVIPEVDDPEKLAGIVESLVSVLPSSL